jgi:hypothetical protein
VVTANGVGVVSHAGTVLLSELADRFGMSAALSEAMHTTRRRSGGRDPGRVLADLAVALADGAETITDLRTLADQELLHGPVASTATGWRVLKSVNATRLVALRTAHAVARSERAGLRSTRAHVQPSPAQHTHLGMIARWNGALGGHGL